ncbi:MAG: DNA recombination protein RmuC [Proteobacteria bacterium]|nr:DNA recombination protein RmuC [Pseudomonadota bacterium]MBU4010282.1 DNA recombination protein RmuC [Pseudomonadota bacterium]MBU4037047.1 DNA recombination protein RmuC [Pseudomonadota bacterium]
MTDVLLILVCLLSGLSLIFIILILRRQPEDLETKLKENNIGLEKHTANIESVVKKELVENRKEYAQNSKSAREELGASLKDFGDSLSKRIAEIAGMQKNQLDTFSKQLLDMTRLNEEKLESMRLTMESRLSTMQEENSKKLELMRATVDEKLHATLETRLGESFKQVSERLEQVYKGLGEMRSLATGVGDLKKVLTNVKTRGTWGEVQLGALLEQILSPEQYEANVVTKRNSRERVEFAIKLPGQDPSGQHVVWMPIDAKFPQEDYQRLIDAQEAADKDLAEKSLKNLEIRIKAEAKDIREKYICPPDTTDFALMFIPTEGLYAEIIRRPGLCDILQREYRVVVAGPTTLAALLNSLQMGFKTLAIEKRSSEIWQLLGAVKSEFGKFGDILAKTKKKLDEAAKTIESAEIRTRAIERSLRTVQQTPSQPSLLPEDDDTDKSLQVFND